MLYDTVNIPHVSTVNLPASNYLEVRDNYRMESREEKIAYIRRRMKELDLNPRSLSVKATGKEDTVRNLFRGVSKNWRQDNYEAIMSVIGYPNPKESPTVQSEALSPIEQALLLAVQAVVLTVTSKPIVKKKDFERMFTHLRKVSRRENRSAAIEVMDQLLDSLNPQPHQVGAQEAHKLLSLEQAGSL